MRSVSLRESLKTKRGEKCYVMLFKEELQWLLAKVGPLVESARNKTSTCFVGRMKYSTAANRVSMPGFNLTRACHTSVSSYMDLMFLCTRQLSQIHCERHQSGCCSRFHHHHHPDSRLALCQYNAA